MSRSDGLLFSLLLLGAGLYGAGVDPASAGPLHPGEFGQPASPNETARFVAIPPSGAGLPAGHGDVAAGAVVFANACASCHGTKLEGVKTTGAPALVGGRGTLATEKPFKTVESNWPYATTLFDYTKRAMPFNAPGSLTDDQVYAVTAYILAEGHIIPANATMDAKTLPKVAMPNRDGFILDPRPH